jgi:hypothetical protein
MPLQGRIGVSADACSAFLGSNYGVAVIPTMRPGERTLAQSSDACLLRRLACFPARGIQLPVPLGDGFDGAVDHSLDHVLVAMTDLAAAARAIEAEHGLTATEGGQHLLRGSA